MDRFWLILLRRLVCPSAPFRGRCGAHLGSSGVRKSTAKRITDLAENLAYKGKAKPTDAIQFHCLVSMDLFDSDTAGFYREIIESIEIESDLAGIPIKLVFLEQDAEVLERIKALASDDVRNGFLLVGIDDENLQKAAAEIGQIVLVNATDPTMRYDGVTPANRRGAYLGTRHLLDLGHRRIAHFTMSERTTIYDRLVGYRLALNEYGIDYDPDLVFDVAHLRPYDSAAATRKALEAGKLDVTGIFCTSDLVAVGAVSAIERAGLSVPGDFSVVGFDNTRVTARHQPGLTTLSVDLREVGRQCVKRLLERLQNPSAPSLDIHVGCELIVRESSQRLA